MTNIPKYRVEGQSYKDQKYENCSTLLVTKKIFFLNIGNLVRILEIVHIQGWQ